MNARHQLRFCGESCLQVGLDAHKILVLRKQNFSHDVVGFRMEKFARAHPGSSREQFDPEFLQIGLAAKPQLVPRIHALLGQVYASGGDTKRAIEEYKLGLPSDDDGSVHFQLGRLYQKSGETKLAAEAFADSKAINQRKQIAGRNTFGRQQKDVSPQP